MPNARTVSTFIILNVTLQSWFQNKVTRPLQYSIRRYAKHVSPKVLLGHLQPQLTFQTCKRSNQTLNSQRYINIEKEATVWTLHL